MPAGISRVLLEERAITPQQLQEALDRQQREGGTLESALVWLGLVSQEEIDDLLLRLGELLGIPIHWEGELVGFVVEAESETIELGRSQSLRGRWKPAIDSAALSPFLERLEASERGVRITQPEGPVLRSMLLPDAPRVTWWFSLDHARTEALVYYREAAEGESQAQASQRKRRDPRPRAK